MAYYDRDLSELRLLIADDNPINRRFMQGVFKNRVAELIVCQDGKQAISNASTTHYDVLLLDLHMPEVDGLTVMQTVRQLYGAKKNTNIGNRSKQFKLPLFVILTADARISEQKRLLDLGFHGFLTKPIGIEELLHSLEQINQSPGIVQERLNIKSASQSDVDTSAALSVLNNDVELLAMMREKMLQELPEIINNINIAMSLQAWEEAYDQVHMLAGSCAYTGAKALGECCDQLQMEIKKSSTTRLDNLENRLKSHLNLRELANRTAIQFLEI